MNPLAIEIQNALQEIQKSLDEGRTLSEKDMQTLFLASLAEEATRGEA